LKKLIIVLGPTGVGKTDLSLNLATLLDSPIISADSRQIYKELKIGTAAPDETLLAKVKHYMVGNKSIFDYYNASMFELEVLEILENEFRTRDFVMLVGGATLYIDAVCYGIDDLPTIDTEIRQRWLERFENEGIESLRFELKRLDPNYYKTADINNPKRLLKALEIFTMTGKPYSTFLTQKNKQRNFEIVKIGLNRKRDELYQRIDLRVDEMVNQGLEDEARQFFEFRNHNSLNTVGYKEWFDYFENKTTRDEAIELIKRNSRRYAKRQLTWFNRHKDINWFDANEPQKVLEFAKQLINNNNP
jgi:tRNA dimethylallyltransferase